MEIMEATLLAIVFTALTSFGYATYCCIVDLYEHLSFADYIHNRFLEPVLYLTISWLGIIYVSCEVIPQLGCGIVASNLVHVLATISEPIASYWLPQVLCGLYIIVALLSRLWSARIERTTS